MHRTVPLWFFLLCALLGVLGTVAFGWAVKSTLAGSDRSGALGRIAVEVAEFPTLTWAVLTELSGFASGSFVDGELSVARDSQLDLSDFTPIQSVDEIAVPGLLMRAEPSKITNAWRVLAGAFQINGEVGNAVLLISPALEVVHFWSLNELPNDELETRPKYRKLVHGVAILSDGSIIFAFDGGVSLQRFGPCGERRWSTPGYFNHSVTLSGDKSTVWTHDGPDVIAQVDVEDGTVLREFSISDMIESNPELDILEIRRLHDNEINFNQRDTEGQWLQDPLHPNDVEPLTPAMADAFPLFQPGDLLLSMRSLNLLFVVDPATQKVKWWRSGAVQRQHDPDWLPDGRIMVFNNRMSRDYSQVVIIDPSTFEKTVVLDGRKHNFYSRIRGKQQLYGDTLAVTSPQQGRAFELDEQGEISLEIINTKPGDETLSYVLTELRLLPLDYINRETWECEPAE